MTRGFILRERERERERVCLRALLQFKAYDAVLYKWPYLGKGMDQIRLRIFAI